VPRLFVSNKGSIAKALDTIKLIMMLYAATSGKVPLKLKPLTDLRTIIDIIDNTKNSNMCFNDIGTKTIKAMEKKI